MTTIVFVFFILWGGGGYWSVEFGLGFFYAGLHMGLLVVPSCGSYSGLSVGRWV